jgi:hypothetical protein
MKTILTVLSALLALSSCSRSDVPSLSRARKIDGPNVKTLTHDELMAVLHECHQFGSSDDPRVKYAIAYCSAAQNAHSMEGYTAPSSAVVDPTLNNVH